MNLATRYGMAGLAFAGMGSIQETDRPLLYIPDLAPVGSGSAYYPRSVDDDAVALNVLGFSAGFPGGGNGQKSDMANEEGAFDSTFRGAVTAFQRRNPASGVADGWIGPNTRRALAAAVAQFNLTAIPGSLPAPRIPPAAPAPGGGSSPAPGKVVPAVPGAKPVAAPAEDNTVRNVAIGVGVVALLTGGYFLLK